MIETPTRRGTLQLLADPVFGPYIGGRLLSTAGLWVFNIVAAVVMWNLTHSNFTVGSVSIALFAPQLLLAPVTGSQADVRNLKAQLLLGRLIATTASAALALTIGFWGVQQVPSPWLIVSAAAFVGAGFAISGPAQRSVLPSLVRDPELSQAVALNTLPPMIGRAGGPTLGTWILAAAGPAVAFFVASVTNLVYGVVLAALPLSGRVERAQRGNHGVRDALTFLRQDRTTTFLLIGMIAVGVGADPAITLTPALSANLGHGESLAGVLAAIFGVGAVIAYIGIRPVERLYGDQGLTGAGLLLLSLGLAVTGVAPTAMVAAGAMTAAGLGYSWTLVGLTTRIYDRVPPFLRGRVMALWSMAFLGARPVTAGVSGLIADLSSVVVAFLFVGAWVAVLGVWAQIGSSISQDVHAEKP